MKKFFILIWLLFLLFSCSNSEYTKKIQELENRISKLEQNNSKFDLEDVEKFKNLLSEWYPPEDAKSLIIDSKSIDSKSILNIEWTYSSEKWTLLIHKQEENIYYYNINVNKKVPNCFTSWKLVINWNKWMNNSAWCDVFFEFIEDIVKVEDLNWIEEYRILDWSYKKVDNGNPKEFYDLDWTKISFTKLYY